MAQRELIEKVMDDLKRLNDSFMELYKDDLEIKDDPAPEKTKVTLEEVRGILADKSRNGFTADVRSLITSFGAEKLSEVDPAKFEDLLKAAEGIGK